MKRHATAVAFLLGVFSVLGTAAQLPAAAREELNWATRLKAIREPKVQPQPGPDPSTLALAVDMAPFEPLLRAAPGKIEVSVTSQGRTVARLGSFERGKGGWTAAAGRTPLLPLPLTPADLRGLRTKNGPGGPALCFKGKIWENGKWVDVEVVLAFSAAQITEMVDAWEWRKHNLDKVNFYRAKVNAAPLKLDASWTSFAYAASQDLMKTHAAHAYFNKNASGLCAENQGYWLGNPIVGWPSAPDVKATIDGIVAQWWAEGPGQGNAHGHYTNMANTAFTKLGAGIVVDKSGGKLYLTNDFGP